jgi:aminomethyltransferase
VGEAGLAWVVGKDRREAGSFIGSERTLAELKKGGTIRKRTGITVEKGAPARGTSPSLLLLESLLIQRRTTEGAKIFTADGSKEIGIVTSGLPSPTVGQNISMGYIQTADGYNKKGTEVLVEVRKKMRKGTVTSMPWITPWYYRG